MSSKQIRVIVVIVVIRVRSLSSHWDKSLFIYVAMTG